jgi:uncharacterized protein YbjT (DUF2867 family)
MRVLGAGATGVIGRQVVPLLASVGHDVIGLTRSENRAAALERTGAEVLVADALDPSSVTWAVRHAAPTSPYTCSPRSRRRSIRSGWRATSR